MECIGEEFLPWVAQYLVMKRASIEHNFHTLYSNFIDHLKKPEFLVVVIAETYRNIKVMGCVNTAAVYLLTYLLLCHAAPQITVILLELWRYTNYITYLLTVDG